MPDSGDKSFNEAVSRLQEATKAGTPIAQDNPDWTKAYSVISEDMATSPKKSAEETLKLIDALPPGSKQSDSAWSLFHNDISKLEQSGDPEKTRQAVALLGKAITSENGISGIRDDSGAGTLQNLEKLSDADLAQLNPQARTILIQQLTTVQEGINSNPSLNTRSDDTVDLGGQFSQQIERLKKTGEGQSPGDADKAVAATQAWRETNTSLFLIKLDEYSKDNLKGATNLLTDVMTDPAAKDMPDKNAIWNTYAGYIGKLSDRKAENAEQNIETANTSMQRVYNALPADDTSHRHALEAMAANNNYDLATGKPIDPNYKLIPEKAQQQDNAEARAHPGGRYEVSEASAITASLPVPPQNFSRNQKVFIS